MAWHGGAGQGRAWYARAGQNHLRVTVCVCSDFILLCFLSESYHTMINKINNSPTNQVIAYG